MNREASDVSVAGDVIGDGHSDVIVGAIKNDTTGITADAPVARLCPEPVLHTTGCFVTPVSEYEIRAVDTAGEGTTKPLLVATVNQPADGKIRGDVVGVFDGLAWTAPQGIANSDDVLTAIQPFMEVETARHLTRTDVEPEELNRKVAFNHVLLLIKALQGDDYAFSSPDGCFSWASNSTMTQVAIALRKAIHVVERSENLRVLPHETYGLVLLVTERATILASQWLSLLLFRRARFT